MIIDYKPNTATLLELLTFAVIPIYLFETGDILFFIPSDQFHDIYCK